MTTTPDSLRTHIGIFGRVNTGKSSFTNLVTGQSTSIVSPVAGTTTDVVRKSMELLPLGPVTLLDTAGLDDASEVGPPRAERTLGALATSDIAVLVLESGVWTDSERMLVDSCARQNTPLILVVNKVDRAPPSESWLAEIGRASPRILECSCARAAVDGEYRESRVVEFKRLLLDACPESRLEARPILQDLLPRGAGLKLAVLIVPIDPQAPKGRLILPQVQSIRDALDSDASVAVVKESGYGALLDRLAAPPDLVVCDSQVARKMVDHTPRQIPCTTFSILFARFKGDIGTLAEGAAVLSRLKGGDRVLIAEACSHHPLKDDIGRVKIPRWIREAAGEGVAIDHRAGKDYPADLTGYRLVIHCGGCALTRREMLWRIEQARSAGVPVTNYGMAIRALQGVLERTLGPFPQALQSFRSAREGGERRASA